MALSDADVGLATAPTSTGLSDEAVGLTPTVFPKSTTFSDADVGLSSSPAPQTEEAVKQTAGIVENAKQGLIETAKGFIPRSVGQAVSMVTPLPGAFHNIAQGYGALKDWISGKSLDQIQHERFPDATALAEADKTPAFSKERFAAGFGTLAQMGMLAAGARGLTKAEPKPSTTEGAADNPSPELQPEQTSLAPEQVVRPAETGVLNASEVRREPPPVSQSSDTQPQSIEKVGETTNDKQQGQTQNNPNGVQAEEVQQSNAAPDVPNGTGTRADNVLGSQGQEVTDAGSTPAEPPRVTSIKNEQVDAERTQRGLEPAMAAAGRDFGNVWDTAMSEIEKNPERTVELVQELKEKPRALSDTEDALLLHRQIDLQNQFEKTANDLSIANDGGNLGLVDELNLRAAKLSDDLLDVYNAGRGAGTETGRALNARKMLAAEDYSLASMITKKRAANKGGQLTPEQVADVGRANQQIKAAQQTLDEYEAKRLAAFKKRTVKRTEELKAKTAAGDFTTKQRTPIQLDTEGLHLKANLERAKLEFQKGLTKDRLSQRPTWEKALDGIAKWRRTFVLTWPTVFAKLTSASGELIGITPLEEVVRSGVTRVLPKRVILKAERYGAGMNVRTEVKAVAHTFRTLFKAAGQKFKTGNSDIDLLYGKPEVLPHELKDYIGNLHSALKEPARQNEFLRSFEQYLGSWAGKGIDITDPLVQTKVGFKAYEKANQQIFNEKNMVADAIQRGLSRFGEVNKQTGKVSVIGKATQTGIKFELPIVRIPLNIVKRTFEYSFGTASGSFRLARALVNGLDKLKPEEADIIVRNLSRGSLGLAFVAYGYFNPEQIGGYYQQGEKRGPDEAQAGGIQIGGLNIPRVLVHNPLLEQLQIGSTIRRVADSKLRKRDVDPQGYAAGVMAAYGGLIEEVPFVQQAERSLKALNPHERKEFLGELLRSTVPGVSEWAARTLDTENGQPVLRKPEEPIDYVKAAVPFLRQDVPERVNKARSSGGRTR